MMSGDMFPSAPPPISSFTQEPNLNPNANSNQSKRKRNLPGTPDPDAEVIALSPKSLMATNRFVCEICNKGFQRDQNLQLHRRGHNLPWKLKQRNKLEVVKKKVYICPEESCVHHDPSRALGDLTGVKKHYSRKHGEKKWKCEKCSKKYAVQSDWKAHSKICGTREYKCDCGTLFSRKDSFITHRAFCDALTEESSRITALPNANLNFANEMLNGSSLISNLHQTAPGNPQFSALFGSLENGGHQLNLDGQKPRLPIWLDHANSHLNNPLENPTSSSNPFLGCSSNSGLSTEMMQWLSRSQDASFPTLPQGLILKEEEENKGEAYGSLYNVDQLGASGTPVHMSATALLQKAAQMGSTRSSNSAFGLMSASLSNSLSQSRNGQVENLNGMMTSISSPGNGDGLFMGNSNGRKLAESLMMMPGNVSKEGKASGNEVEGNLTRDFLGVEGNERRPFLQQELTKFASMGAAMNFSQFSGSQ